MFCQLTLISKKAPMQKYAKNAKNYQILNNFSSLVLFTRHFTKFIFLEQLIAMPKFNMQNMFDLFFFFFLSSHHDANPFFICIIFVKFVKKYNYILAYINSESARVIYFFLSSPSESNVFFPSKFCNHLKHSAK